LEALCFIFRHLKNNEGQLVRRVHVYYWAIAILAGIMGGAYMYYQATLPSLHGQWTGTLALSSGAIEFEINVVQAGEDNSRSSGPLLGEMIFDGDPLGDGTAKLQVVGELRMHSEPPTVVMIVQRPEPDGETSTNVIMMGTWEADELKNGSVTITFADSSPALMGTWQASR
jgi:hypothetical protein